MDTWLDSDRVCSFEEAADFLNLSVSKLNQLVEAGKIPSSDPEGKLLACDVLRYSRELEIQIEYALQELSRLGQELQGDDDPEEDPVISHRQAAHILRISPLQLSRLVEAGEIPMPGHGRMKFAMKDLREFNERRDETIDLRYSLSRDYEEDEE